MASESVEVYDLLIVVDGTASMRSYIHALQTSLPKVIQISTLTDCFQNIGLLCYRDYSAGFGRGKDLLEWSGWMSPSAPAQGGSVDLVGMARGLQVQGNESWPEASKTGLAKAYEVMREDATTIILLYTDAPPHTFTNGQMKANGDLRHEQTALAVKTSYGGFGPDFMDMVSASKRLSGRVGNKKAQVFSILDTNMPFNDAGYYNYLSETTNGACIYLQHADSASISKVTIEILLSWMGVEKAGNKDNSSLPGFLTSYITTNKIMGLKGESDPHAKIFFAPDAYTPSGDVSGEMNIRKVLMNTEVLKKEFPKKANPVADFATRYAADESYKRLAVQQLKNIIKDDVTAISLNPVFGSLWRTVCNDRENEQRDELVTLFGYEVDQIKDAMEKASMKTWLAESYDYTADVMAIIASVPDDQKYPCVCLDPTLAFTKASDISNAEGEENKPITEFTRDELLEIGRSCDYRILRRLGRVLTRLTYINSAEEMPAHIAAVPESELPRIPIALAGPEFKRKFWKILLHIVVPGTMLSTRPAALLAALSIRLGIQPLLKAADQEVMLWRDRWNNLEVPETWNTNCLSLLIDADVAYRKREQPTDEPVSEFEGLLKVEDKALFETLVNYKLLEHNLDTNLTANVGWTPDRTRVPMGPTAVCTSCKFPRSVSVMGPNSQCGFCIVTDYASPEEKEERLNAHVTHEDNADTPISWLECNLRTCRAQYAIYNPSKLNVKPKCHYCREGKRAPCLECTECLNRVIYPEEYRQKDMVKFVCYACTAGRKTTVGVETTASKITLENSNAWLLRNEDNKIEKPFNKGSVFKVISAAGTADFCKKVQLFPESAQTKLQLDGKVIRNIPELVKELHSWVYRRKVENSSCSLCFSTKRKADLFLACGRRGCAQRICTDCLGGWYGLNAIGQIINTAALSCPFCRRTPTPKTLAKFGMGIHAVGGLQTAVKEQGQWIFAWCKDCGYAKQYLERVCAAGAPVEISDWSCEACQIVRQSGTGDAKGIKECPGCGVMTQKTSGCDHITCNCGSHWCFFCGKASSAEEIYEHMQDEHGGMYGGLAAEDYEPDED